MNKSKIFEFKQLYENNQHKICMKESGKYSINKENVNRYIKNSCITSSHNLLNFIFDNIKYITFDEFYSSLEKYIMQINKVHRGNNNDMIIKAYIIIPDFNFTKSTCWVSLLIEKIIRDNSIKFIIFDIIKNIGDFPTDLAAEYILIIADDCAYTGNQIIGTIDYYRGISFANKIYMVIPYICNYARNYFNIYLTDNMGNDIPNIIFLHECITYLEMFTELCIKKNFNIYKEDVYYLDFTEYQKKANGEKYKVLSLVKDHIKLPKSGMMIYFDHKIADHISTIESFLHSSKVLEKVYIYDITSDSVAEENFEALKESYGKYSDEKALQYFANDYCKEYLDYVKDNFNIRKNPIICIKEYEIIINNCDNNTLLEECPPTFLNTLKNLSIYGGYRKKYLVAKRNYLKLKNIK